MTMSELIRRSLAGPRFNATLATTFSVIATFLAALGVFGLVSYVISRRRHEFGIRSALGARPRDLVLTALQSAVALTALGLGMGIAVAAFLTRFIETQLYDVKPLDAATFIGAGTLMLVITAMAAAIPVRQVLRIDPMATLR